jgi:hypothetical protein
MRLQAILYWRDLAARTCARLEGVRIRVAERECMFVSSVGERQYREQLR